MSIKPSSRFWECALPIILGVAAFLLVVGLSPLDPTNIAWLSGQDPSAHYLGWAFFSHTKWHFPIGLNPSYGLIIGSSIVFSDSIPLLAFLFKPFSTLLSEPFQYIGIWALLCFILQSWFSWKLAGLISDDWRLKILICGLLGVFAPPFLKRLGLHAALMGQFVILAGLYINLKTQNTKHLTSWLVLIIMAALINFYLLVMVFALWIVNWLNCIIHGQSSSKQASYHAVTILFCTTVCMWQAGYFVGAGSTIQAEGFGYYKLNALSLFDAGRYSYILKNLPHPEDLEEGFNFLGLGIIFLIPFVFFALIKKTNAAPHFAKPNYPLYTCLIILTIFALSNHISIGLWGFTYPLPDFILEKAGILRSSGRLFWPVFYILVFTLLRVIATRYPKKISLWLLGAALVIQITDTSAGWHPLRKTFINLTNNPTSLELDDSFWRTAGNHYKQIIFWPLRVNQTQEHWRELSYFAAKYHMGTNAVYLGRSPDPAKVKQFNEETKIQINSGKLQKNKLYVLNDSAENQQWLSTLSPTSQQCLWFKDNFIVLSSDGPGCNLLNEKFRKENELQ